MRLKTFSCLAGLAIFVGRCALAQEAPLPAGNEAVLRLELPSKTFPLTARALPENWKWQPAPDGIGEISTSLASPGRDDFTWGKWSLKATSQGLLSREAKNAWQIVPEVYGQGVRIAGDFGEMLWVERAGQGLVALNGNLEIVRRLRSVQGRCVAIEAQGFWCLDSFSESYWDGSKANALVEYDAEGREKRRFVVENGALVKPPAEPVERGVFGGGRRGSIFWTGFDDDAVWVSLNDYHRGAVGYADLPMREGTEKLGRLDRTTGAFSAVEWSVPAANRNAGSLTGTQFLLLPDKIQWLASVGLDEWDVFELDKKTLQISRALKIVAPGYALTTQGKNLWLLKRYGDPRDRDTRVYDRQTLHNVPLGDAGLPPGGEERDSRSAFELPLGLLEADAKGVWLGAPKSSLLAVRDDGTAANFHVNSPSGEESPFFSFASQNPPGNLLWFASEQLMQTRADGVTSQTSLSGVWKKKAEQTGPETLDFLTATEQRLWFNTSRGHLVTLLPDFSAPREIGENALFGKSPASRTEMVRADRGSIAVGDSLYVWAESGDLLRVDGLTGSVQIVDSWAGGADATLSARRRNLGRRPQRAFILPDGRIAFPFDQVLDYIMNGPLIAIAANQIDKPHLFLFDPIKDSWQESAASTLIQPISAGKNLFGADAEQLYGWKKDGWVALGKRPLLRSQVAGQGPPFPPDVPAFGTEKYFYQPTELGLFRAPWSLWGAR